MDWVECKFVGALGPDLAEIFVGREAVEGLEPLGEEAFDGSFLDGTISIRPRRWSRDGLAW